MKIIDIPYFGKKYFLPKLIRREGGQQTSTTLRKIYKNRYKIDVDMYTYGCFDPELNYALGGEVHIGKYCSFAKGIRYFAANHPIDYVSMSPYFYNKKFGFDVKDVHRSSLTIGHGVWCGYGALITSGCKVIGNGSVIAAGAVVTHDVPPYAIVGGNPARIIKYRFDTDTISCIEESKWWEYTPDVLYELYATIGEPKLFCQKLSQLKKQTKETD